MLISDYYKGLEAKKLESEKLNSAELDSPKLDSAGLDSDKLALPASKGLISDYYNRKAAEPPPSIAPPTLTSPTLTSPTLTSPTPSTPSTPPDYAKVSTEVWEDPANEDFRKNSEYFGGRFNEDPMYAVPLNKRFMGAPRVDYGAFQAKLQDLHYADLLRKDDKSILDLSKEEQEQYWGKAEHLAKKEIAKARSLKWNIPWVEVEPEAVTDWIMEKPSWMRGALAAFMPTVAAVSTDDGAVEAEYRPTLAYFAKFGPSTLWAAGIKTKEGVSLDEGWGKAYAYIASAGAGPMWAYSLYKGDATPVHSIAKMIAGAPILPLGHSREAVEFSRAGKDIVDVAWRIGGNIHDETGINATAAGIIATGGIILTEPNLLDIPLLGLGKGVKALVASRKVATLTRYNKAFQQVFDNADNFTDLEEVVTHLDKTTGSSAASHAFITYFGPWIQKDADIIGQVGSALKDADKTYAKIAKLKAAEKVAADGAEKIRLQQMVDELEWTRLADLYTPQIALAESGYQQALRRIMASPWAKDLVGAGPKKDFVARSKTAAAGLLKIQTKMAELGAKGLELEAKGLLKSKDGLKLAKELAKTEAQYIAAAKLLGDMSSAAELQKFLAHSLLAKKTLEGTWKTLVVPAATAYFKGFTDQQKALVALQKAAAKAAAYAAKAPTPERFVEQVQKVAGKLAEEFATARKLAGVPVREFRRNVLAEVTVGNKVDTTKLYATVVERYGQVAADDLMSITDKELTPIMDLVRRGKGSGGVVTLSSKTLAEAHRAIQDMEQYAAARLSKYQDTVGATAILISGLDPNIQRFSIGEKLQGMIAKFKSKLGADASKIGEYNRAVGQVVRGIANYITRGNEELIGLIRSVEKDPSKLSLLLSKYMDSTKRLPLPDGTYTVANTDTSTLWEKFRRAVLTDARIDKATKKLKPGESRDLNQAFEAAVRMWLHTGDTNLDPNSSQVRLLRKLAFEELQKATSGTEFINKMEKVTFQIFKRTDPTKHKARVYGAMAMLYGSAEINLASGMRRAMGGRLTAEEAADFNRVLGTPGSIEDVDKAFELFNRIGAPIGQRSVRVGGGRMAAELKELVVHGDDFRVPANLISEIQKTFGNIIKDLDANFARSRAMGDTQLAQFPATFLKYWKTSAVTGLIIPKPRAWVNNIVGDFSQIWLSESLPTATRMSFQNFATNLPGPWGRQLQNWASLQSYKYKDTPVLGSVFNALMNPYLGKIMKGENVIVRSASGEVMESDELLREALEDGVFQSFISSEFLSEFRKVQQQIYAKGLSGRASRAARNWQTDVSAHLELVQQRQRLGLYLEMRVNQGRSRGAAGKATMNALYDWGHDFAQWELRTLATYVPFYRFFKLAGKQLVSSTLEGFTNPTGGNLLKAATGRTPLARLSASHKLVDAAPTWAMGLQNQGMELEELEELTTLSQAIHPDWVTPVPKYISQYNDDMVYYYLNKEGRDVTHKMQVFPRSTPLDMAQLMLAPFVGLAGAGVALTQGATISGDLLKKTAEPLFNTLGPQYRFIGERLLGLQDEGIATAQDIPISKGEAAVLDYLGAGHASDLYREDPEDNNRLKGNFWWVTALRLMPVVGMQIPDNFNAVMQNPYIDSKEYGKAVGYGFKHILGFKEYAFNRDKLQSYKDKDETRRLKGRVRDLESLNQPSAYIPQQIKWDKD